MPPLSFAILNFVTTVLFMLVLVAGILVGIHAWKRSRLVSMLTITGVILLMSFQLGRLLTFSLLVYLNQYLGWQHSQIQMLTSAANGLLTLLLALGCGFLLAAIFQGRTRSQPETSKL